MRKLAAFIVLAIISLAGCFDLGPDTREAVTIKEAIEAIKADDFKSYRKYSVNGQDLINTVVEGDSLSGNKVMSAVFLKPREDRRIRAVFERVYEGGAGMIDFSKETFKGIKLISKGNWEPPEVDGRMRKIKEIPIEVYGVVTTEGGEAGAERFPHFALAKQGDRPFIIEIQLPPGEEPYIPTDAEIEATQPNRDMEEDVGDIEEE